MQGCKKSVFSVKVSPQISLSHSLFLPVGLVFSFFAVVYNTLGCISARQMMEATHLANSNCGLKHHSFSLGISYINLSRLALEYTDASNEVLQTLIMHYRVLYPLLVALYASQTRVHTIIGGATSIHNMLYAF